ncbi:hypothetical protein C1H46_011759 [Malus baccata]|uniref:Uncharacterized protein n=1 Tax=Malus baccata TaxID=106549 RepID=A0A540MWH0_MALBA|nr:hypothetical protein C1H46_011759 [Malus baccata]
MAGQQSIYGHNKDGELNSPSAHKLSPLGNSLDLMNYHSLSRTRYVEEKTAVEDEKVVNNKEQTSVSSFDLSSSQGKKKSGGEGKEQDHYALLGLSHLRSLATEEQLPSSVGAESSHISRSHTICSQKYHFDAGNKTKIGVPTQIVVHEFQGCYVLQLCNGECIFDIQLGYHMRISDKGGGIESTLIWVLWYTRYNGNIRAPDARRLLFAGYACSSDQILYSPIVTISCLNHHELAGGC